MCIISLLITFNGNWIIKDIFRIISSVFSVVFRAALMDGAIFAQIMFLMMKRRKRFPYTQQNNKKYIIGTVIVNLILLGLLYFF